MAGEHANVRVVGGCEFSVAAPWGEMHVLGYFLPPDAPVLESFLQRCRADRRRRAEEMVQHLQRLGVDLSFESVLQSRRRRRGPAACGSSDCATWWCCRSHRSVRPLSPPRQTRLRRKGASQLCHRCGSGARVRRAGFCGPPQGPGHAGVPRAAQVRRARRASRPGTRVTTASCAPGSPISPSGWACSAPAAATGMAIPSPAAPTARSARRRCRWSGWSAAGQTARGPRQPAASDERLLAPGAPAPDFSARRLGRRDLSALASCCAIAGCCWSSIPATTRPAETANSPPCAMRSSATRRCNVRPFGVNPASVESHADYAARLKLPFPLLSDAGLRISRELRRAPAGRLGNRAVGLPDRPGRDRSSTARPGAPGRGAEPGRIELPMTATVSISRGKVVLVTGVGRAGQIGNAVALAFGQAGAKIVACDLNAVGVAERVREFAAAGGGRPALRRRSHAARHRRARGGDRAQALRPAGRGGERRRRAHHLRPDRGAHRPRPRSGDGDQSEDGGARLPGRDCRPGRDPGVHRQLRLDRLLRAAEPDGGLLARPRRRWRGLPRASRSSCAIGRIRVNAIAPGDGPHGRQRGRGR